jgi:hypothetical protein
MPMSGPGWFDDFPEEPIKLALPISDLVSG